MNYCRITIYNKNNTIVECGTKIFSIKYMCGYFYLISDLNTKKKNTL